MASAISCETRGTSAMRYRRRFALMAFRRISSRIAHRRNPTRPSAFTRSDIDPSLAMWPVELVVLSMMLGCRRYRLRIHRVRETICSVPAAGIDGVDYTTVVRAAVYEIPRMGHLDDISIMSEQQ